MIAPRRAAIALLCLTFGDVLAAAHDVVELPDRQSMVLVRDGRYRLESDTVFPGAIRFHYLTIGSPTARGSVDLIRWRDGNEIDRTQAPTGAEKFSDLLLLAHGLLLADARTRAPQLAFDDASGDVRVTFRDRAGRTSVIVIDPATKLVKAATAGDQRYIYEELIRAELLPVMRELFLGDNLRAAR